MTMAEIKYVTGDATCPEGKGKKALLHIVNDLGAFGRGFTGPLALRYPVVETDYRKCVARNKEAGVEMLGLVLATQVKDDLEVLSLFAQHGLPGKKNPHPLDLAALRKCLVEARERVLRDRRSVHMPRIGTGIARGDWGTIESIILVELVEHGVFVTVYDLP